MGLRPRLGLLLALLATSTPAYCAAGHSSARAGTVPAAASPESLGLAPDPKQALAFPQALPRADAAKEVAAIRELIRTRALGDAEKLARQLLQQAESAQGPESAAAADALDLVVESLQLGGESRQPEIRSLAERALRLREKLHGSQHPQLLPSLVNLASVLKDLSGYAGAKPLLERALAIRERQLGPDDPLVADDLAALGIVLRQLSDYGQAKQRFERALTIRERRFGREDASVAALLTYLGIIAADLGDNDRARPLCRRALAIRERQLGPDDPLVAQTLNVLGNLLSAQGEYGEARRVHERALAIREKAFGPDDVRVADSLHNLAALLADTGEYDAARPLCERALAIQIRTLGPEHDLVGSSLSNLGNLLRWSGEYAAALARYQEALAIHARTLGRDNPRLAQDLMLLAGLEHEMGADAEARQHYDQALEIRRRALGPEHRDVADCLHALGRFLLDMGQPAEARPLLEETLAIREHALGAGHPIVGLSRADLARDAGALGDRRRARRLYAQALRVLENAHGPRHEAVAECLRSFGDFLSETGDRAAARHCYERALAINKAVFGVEHPEAGRLWERIAWLDFALGDTTTAFTAALAAEGIGREHLRLTTRSLSEDRARRFSHARSSGLDLVISLAASGASRSDEVTARAWDALIRSRALVLDEMAARHRAVAEADDPEVSRLAQALGQARRRLANLAVRGVGGDRPERYRASLDEARRSKEEAERTLAEKSLAFRRERERAGAGFSQAAEALPAGSALVAYARYEQCRRDAERAGSAERAVGFVPPHIVKLPSYVAFVLPGPGRAPVLVPLGAAAPIDTLIAAWSAEVTSGPRRHGLQAERYYREVGNRLRQAIWDPLTPHLGTAERVFVVPDAALQLVSPAVLPVGEAQYLVETGPVLHHLSAERDLLRPGGPTAAQGTAAGLLVVGGPDFDAIDTTPGRVTTDTRVATAHAYRGERPSCESFATLRFRSLPAAAHEAEDVTQVWRQAQRHQPAGVQRAPCRRLTKAAATEAAFKQLVAGMQIVHLATHGFFLGTDCVVSSSDERGLQGMRPLGEAARPGNPLLLAGLALAGANHRAEAGPEDEDGVLTAEEIGSLDLTGVHWAVLSGCDTGVGEIAAGEGVFGLRRAFEIAGAGTVIMSLWPVRDDDARQWMRSLYENRLLRRLGTAESIRAAALEMLHARRRAGRPTHPACWGGFVAAGDWR